MNDKSKILELDEKLKEKEFCFTIVMDEESSHVTLPPNIVEATITLGKMDPNNVITITVEDGPIASNSTITATAKEPNATDSTYTLENQSTKVDEAR